MVFEERLVGQVDAGRFINDILLFLISLLSFDFFWIIFPLPLIFQVFGRYVCSQLLTLLSIGYSELGYGLVLV